jgi:hypothetical protein
MRSSDYDGSVDYENGICIHAPASGSRRIGDIPVMQWPARVNT